MRVKIKLQLIQVAMVTFIEFKYNYLFRKLGYMHRIYSHIIMISIKFNEIHPFSSNTAGHLA